MRTTPAALVQQNHIYASIYGAEGCGKTRLAMTLSKTGKDIGYVTPESGGPKSLYTAGFPDVPVDVIEGNADPLKQALQYIQAFARDPSITGIVLDGCTVLCGRAVDFYSGGQGDKAMGFDGWGKLFTGFKAIEKAATNIVASGKTFIFTFWEQAPTYEPTLGGEQLKDIGRPMMSGQAKQWVPGNCDIVARMKSSFRKVKGADGTMTSQYQATLQVNATDLYLAKTRWPLPDPCPADLKAILKMVQDTGGKAPAKAVPVAVAKPPIRGVVKR